jgi:hypothetical protein
VCVFYLNKHRETELGSWGGLPRAGHREKYFMALFLKRAKQRPEDKGRALGHSFWGSLNKAAQGYLLGCRGGNLAGKNLARKEGRPELTPQ